MHYLALKKQNYTYLGEYSQYTSYFLHMCEHSKVPACLLATTHLVPGLLTP